MLHVFTGPGLEPRARVPVGDQTLEAPRGPAAAKEKRGCGVKRGLRAGLVAVRRGSGGSVWRERGGGSRSKAGQRETVPHAACVLTRRQVRDGPEAVSSCLAEPPFFVFAAEHACALLA